MDSTESRVSLTSGSDGRKRRVSYFYDSSIGNYYFHKGHPMKPHRIRMTHNLILTYNLHRRLQISPPNLAIASEFNQFHSSDYIKFLSSVTPKSMEEPDARRNVRRFRLHDDCPVFDGLFDYCCTTVGGSISAAVKLNREDADIAINWAGGMHHARRDCASGFCYVNDIVLGILELLKIFKRVLYIDIDVHHGNAVEEAFYTTDRVMTISFHKFGKFYPGTGDIRDIGVETGKYYSLNAPLKEGLNDESFCRLFKPVIRKAMEVYQPEVIVLQSGADSLSADRLGVFNLSVMGHASCLRYIRSFNVPLMVLGGGGYTLKNVARCWCYETAVAVGTEISNNLPDHDYIGYFGPEYKLHVPPYPMFNENTRSDIEEIRNTLLKQLSHLRHVPSVEFQDTPAISHVKEEPEVDMEVRQDQRILSSGPSYDSDSDEAESAWFLV